MSDASPPQHPPPNQPPPNQPPPNQPPPGQQPPAYGQQPYPQQQPYGQQPPHYAQQPYAQQPYGGPPPYTPPKKKRKIWPWLLGIGLIMMLALGGCVAALVFFATGPIDEANEFLALIEDGDYDEALDSTGPGCFDDAEFQPIIDFFESARLTSYDLTSSSFENSNGTATGTVTLDGDDRRDVEINLINVDGWKVCGIDVSAR